MREPISTVQYRVFRDARKNLFLSEKCLCNIVVAAAAAVYTAWFPLNQCPCPLKWIVFSCCLPRGQTHCTDDTKHDFRISMSFVCQRVALHSPSCCNLTSFGEVSCLSCFFLRILTRTHISTKCRNSRELRNIFLIHIHLVVIGSRRTKKKTTKICMGFVHMCALASEI